MAIYEKYPKSVSQNPKPYENTFRLFTLDICTSAVGIKVFFRIRVSLDIQQAEAEGDNPNIELLSSECVIWYTVEFAEHMHPRAKCSSELNSWNT